RKFSSSERRSANPCSNAPPPARQIPLSIKSATISGFNEVAQTVKGLEKQFNAPVIEAYGMTEAAHQMASNPLTPSRHKPGSVGLPAGPEIGIMAEEGGMLLPPGTSGEIVIGGERIMLSVPEDRQDLLEDMQQNHFRV
ncbi:MAG: AMP-binding protein, partial [Syntrophobacteraceae bacterium]|nr:AMP-binding protein [Syntrophobacteraceae bacterium]